MAETVGTALIGLGNTLRDLSQTERQREQLRNQQQSQTALFGLQQRQLALQEQRQLATQDLEMERQALNIRKFEEDAALKREDIRLRGADLALRREQTMTTFGAGIKLLAAFNPQVASQLGQVLERGGISPEAEAPWAGLTSLFDNVSRIQVAGMQAGIAQKEIDARRFNALLRFYGEADQRVVESGGTPSRIDGVTRATMANEMAKDPQVGPVQQKARADLEARQLTLLMDSPVSPGSSITMRQRIENLEAQAGDDVASPFTARARAMRMEIQRQAMDTALLQSYAVARKMSPEQVQAELSKIAANIETAPPPGLQSQRPAGEQPRGSEAPAPQARAAEGFALRQVAPSGDDLVSESLGVIGRRTGGQPENIRQVTTVLEQAQSLISPTERTEGGQIRAAKPTSAQASQAVRLLTEMGISERTARRLVESGQLRRLLFEMRQRLPGPTVGPLGVVDSPLPEVTESAATRFRRRTREGQ
jgi:hypothetical protein